MSPSRPDIDESNHLCARTRSSAVASACAWCIAILSSGIAGCDANEGLDPPPDGMFFPSGLLLDPRTPEDEEARYLFVVSGNNDLSYNGGSIIAVDLDRFFAAWADEGGGVYPYCDADGGRCVLDATYQVTAERPCRRLALNQQVAECDEQFFTVDSVRIGDFGTVMAASREEGPNGPFSRLWVPVRSEPSLTYVDLLEPNWRARPEMSCGEPDPRGDGLKHCTDRHRLTNLRNDSNLPALGREPFNIMVSDEYRLAYVAHSEGGMLTLVSLDGLVRESTQPAISDARRTFAATNVRSGGFGLAERPCFPAGEGPSGADDPEPNVPAATLGCTRPLVYGTWRYNARLTSFSASPLDAQLLPDGALTRTSCFDDEGNFMGPYCAPPEDIGEPCAVVCDPQIRRSRSIFIPVSDALSAGTRSLLGDLFFADDRGDELFVLQTNPGSLLKFNTSLDGTGNPLDIPSAPPIEICDEPTRMVKFEDEGQRFALITCFRSAYIFVVDLHMHRVVDSIVAGTGPHDLVVDPVRGFLYAANTLESSISVVDLRRTSRTRFREVARIGLQEPYSR